MLKKKKKDGRIGKLVALESLTSRFVAQTENAALELPLIEGRLAQLLGESAAKQVVSVTIEGQSLILGVKDPQWYRALSRESAPLLERVREWVPRLKQVIWRNV